MAPFKLKFRMGSGSSRSASQEQDVVVDNQANQVVSNYLNSNTLGAGYGSSTTLDSEQNNDSLVSMNNDQRALIRDRDSTDDRLGKFFVGFEHCTLLHSGHIGDRSKMLVRTCRVVVMFMFQF